MVKGLLLLALAAALALATSVAAVTVPEDLQLKRQTDPTLWTCRNCLLTSSAKHDYTVKDARKCFKQLAGSLIKQSQLNCKSRCFGARAPSYTLNDESTSKKVLHPGGLVEYQKFVDFDNLDIDTQGAGIFRRNQYHCSNGLLASLECTGCRS
jgi:hypothetical protein